MNVVKCEGLTKKYGRKKVLNEISFKIFKNTITGLIGRNGAGKSTLLNMIAGYVRQSSGEISVFQKQPFNSLFVSANTILVDDHMAFPGTLTLHEIIQEAGRFYKNWDRTLAERLFTYFSFQPGQYYNNLSKGMKSTFNMIIGLSAHCALTLYDEPTSGMDESVRNDFYRALLKDYLAFPRTIIISSHHLDEIEHLLENVLLLNDGRVQLHLPISELKEWAIAIKGEQKLVETWTENKEIIHFERVEHTNHVHAVIKNDMAEQEIEQARQDGLRVSNVAVSDVCVYLTNMRQGRIDDVFR